LAQNAIPILSLDRNLYLIK